MTWLFRATLDQTASGNWTNLVPAIQQTGLNSFCEPALQVPASFAGSKGVIGIAADSPDGILYQVSATEMSIAGTLLTFPSVQQSTSLLALVQHNPLARTRPVRLRLSSPMLLCPAYRPLLQQVLPPLRAPAQARPPSLHLRIAIMDTVDWGCWLGPWWSDLQHFWLAFFNDFGLAAK